MTLHNSIRFVRYVFPILATVVLLAGSCCYAQHDYVGRYDVFVGFSDVNAPFVNNLNQPGFGTQVGFVNNRWLATGFDYSVQSGGTALTPDLLPKTLQMELAASLPPGYQLRVPTDLTIQTFSAGSQLVYRHFSGATFFVHPVLSAFRVEATPRPTDPVAAIVSRMLVPSGKKRDLTGGFGVGGGTDLRVSRHLSARMQVDIAHSHPMNDILGNGGWIYRFSAGPSFHFGRNIESRKH